MFRGFGRPARGRSHRGDSCWVDRSFACNLVPEQYRCIWLVTTSTHTGALAPLPEPGTQEAIAYTDGASVGSRGPGGYGAVLTLKGNTEQISGGAQDTTNLRMEVTAACVALESDRRRARRERLLRLLLPRQLHEERLVREVAGERMAQPPRRACGEQGPVGEAPGRDTAPPGGAMEEGEGALQDWRGGQERGRPGRRARRGREEGGCWGA